MGKPLLDLESELQGDDCEIRPCRSRRERGGDDAAGSSHVMPGEPLGRHKKKEFAWMDSDSESDKEALEKEHATRQAVKKQRTGPRRARSHTPPLADSASSKGPSLPESVSAVTTFSQMMRMSDSLKSRIPTMPASELVQCLAAAGRVKFFDCELLQEMLIPQILRVFTRSRVKSPFTTQELVLIVCSLADLNIFDQSVIAHTLKELDGRKHVDLQSIDRQRLLAALKVAKHDQPEHRAFVEWLCVAVGSERFESMSAEQRMIVGNSKNGMYAPTDYLRTFMIGTTNNGGRVARPHGLSS